MKKKIISTFLILFFFTILILIFSKTFEKKENQQFPENKTKDKDKDKVYSSNIIKDVNYSSKDAKGNEYIINASQGEIDYSDTNTIYLTNVNALVKLVNSNNIKITSDFGKYNTNNFDTIFSKNVIIYYIDNKITGEYLDFSIERNTMIISNNVTYTDPENILKADVIEMDIKTKDTKIFMYESDKKVNIKSK